MSTQNSDVIKKVGSIGEKILKLRRQQTAAGHKRRVRRHSKLVKKQDKTEENDPRTVIEKIYECYEKFFVISRELLSALAFYNDFVSDLQILNLVRKLQNDPINMLWFWLKLCMASTTSAIGILYALRMVAGRVFSWAYWCATLYVGYVAHSCGWPGLR